ncbi:MAG: RluA family pseudouridine synthase [Clostridiales bacterium]|nr:RluA family pseudouridine synthase [Clostridiales bacterium]
MREYIVLDNDAGQRLDKFLLKTEKNLPPPLMYRLIRQKKIKVNGKRTEISYRLIKGDKVAIWTREDFSSDSASDNSWMFITPKLDIVYENNDVIVCDKRPGMLCHSDDSGDGDTLINNIKAYLYQKGDYKPEFENSFAPALCNRIDRNTGGLVIAAKTAASLRHISEEFREGRIVKKYLCAAHGIFREKQATLRDYLVKDSDTNTVSIYKDKPDMRDVKTIITQYRVLSENNGLSLLEVNLLTGRTHQIRAHLAFYSHPLLGDGKYGKNKEDRRLGYKYQALYSYYLEFDDIICEADRSKIWFIELF